MTTSSGLVIIGVPSNDFGGQEPGGATEITQTAHHQYGVTFPIAAKAVVKGPNAHPFYKWAAEARPKEVPRWNFHKYLIGREGYISEVFAESVVPTDTRVKTAMLNDPAVGGLRIDVDTFKGVVTLSGRVKNQAEKDQALALARKIDGVVEVNDALQVIPEGQ